MGISGFIELDMDKTKILLVEDNAMVRELISIVVKQSDKYELVGEVGDGKEAIAQLEAIDPDIIILDALLPDMTGAEVAKVVFKNHPNVKILGITAFKKINIVKELITAGVHGIVFKDDSWKELEKAIEIIVSGESYFSQKVSVLMGQALRMMDQLDGSLTKREKQILKLLANGFGVKDIAKEIDINAKTVNNHITSLKGKLNIHDLPRLIVHAIKLGIVSI